MQFKSDSSAKRIAKNGVFIAVRFSVYILSGVFFIPFLVRQYGTGTYGLIALAGFLTQYVGLISKCVGNSISRFLNVALNRNNWTQANEIYSTALVAKTGFILVQLPVFALGIWKLDWLIDFPADIAQDFRILVACNVLVFFTSMLTGVFSTPIQAANRVDISSILETIQISLRLTLLFILIVVFGAKLWLIGVVDCCLALAHCTIIFFMRRRLAPALGFHWKHVTRRWIKPVLNMAGWAIVTSLGSCLFVKTDVWMINRFVNKNMAGIYAALLIWPNFLKQVSKQLAAVLAPVYLIDYARGDWKRVADLSLSAAKLLGCFVGFCVGGLFVVAEPVLVLWLGEGAEQYVPLFRMMTIYLTYTIGSEVLWQIYITLNKVHFTGIVNLATGILNIVISLTLIHFGFGAMGVAIATVFSMALSSSIAIPFGACREFNMPYKEILKNYAYATLILISSLISFAAVARLSQVSLIGAGFLFVGLFVAGSVLAAKYILSAVEKRRIISGLHWLFGKIQQRNGLGKREAKQSDNGAGDT